MLESYVQGEVPAFAPPLPLSARSPQASGLDMPDHRLARWITLSLDHVGRGMVLVAEHGRVLHVNRLARQAMAVEACPLRLEQGHLRTRRMADLDPMLSAIDSALRRGLRRMVTLAAAADPPGSADMTVAVLPLGDGMAGAGEAADAGCGAALVSLPRTPALTDLAVQCFARQHRLTEAESAVLQALTTGQTVQDIARAKAVAICTVRTQVSQLRAKLGSPSIRELLDRVAGLPPMMAVLRTN